MSRVKRSMIRRTRKKNLRERIKGFFLGHRLLRQGKEAAMRSEKQMFIGRKQKKRAFRRLWNTRINAASRPLGISYSRLIHALGKANIGLNRKMLAHLALKEPATFEAVVKQARSAVGT